MFKLTSSESYVIYRSNVFKVCLGVAVAISMFFIGSMYLLHSNPQLATHYGAESGYEQQITSSLLWPTALVASFSQVQERGAMLAVIIVGTLMSSGYAWGTIRSTLSRGVGRRELYLSKAMAFVVPLILVSVLAPVVTETILSGMATAKISGRLPLLEINWFHYALGTLRAALGVAPYATLAVALAVITRSAVGVVGGGLGMLLAERILLNLFGISSWLKYSPLVLYNNLAANNLLLAGVSPQQVGTSPGLAIVLIAAWSTLFLFVGLLHFQRQDIAE